MSISILQLSNPFAGTHAAVAPDQLPVRINPIRIGWIEPLVALPDSDKSLGIECKYQGGGGSAEEKIPAIIQDISAWPIPGLVVFAGEGFSSNMKSYLHSTGKAVAFEDLDGWLRLFFGLPDS